MAKKVIRNRTSDVTNHVNPRAPRGPTSNQH